MLIPEKFLNLLCCPKRLCRGDLEEIEVNNEKFLKCKICDDVYPIADGIPILFPNSKYSHDVHKRHWDAERNARSYAKKYDGYLKKQGTPWGIYTHISELKAIKRLVKSVGLNLTGGTIIDCGCGNGRLLDDYPEASFKIGIDASLRLLQETKKRNSGYWLVCGQLEDMPFKDCVADFTSSVRVFQHLKIPEHAFSEMARITRPSGYVSLEVYNKINLKELYKRFRMVKFIDKIKPWGLSYDRYFSWREIKSWSSENFIKPLKFTGAGWGVNSYLLAPIGFRRFMPNFIQNIIFNFFIFIEDIIGNWPFFSKTMEKVCFIGSLQSGTKKMALSGRIYEKLTSGSERRKVSKWEKLFEERNYCFTGSDKHHLQLTIEWLKRAQDASADAGVSRGFSLIKSNKFGKSGWQPSYPETTGYIIPTFIKAGKFFNDEDLIRRARLMADWEINVMLKEGAVQSGNITKKPVPVVFNTGQVIRGLHALYVETGENKYLEAAKKSAKWILDNEDGKSGNWINNNTAIVKQKMITYNIYAIAPVVELGASINDKDMKEAGFRAGEFTVGKQQANGWIDNADFNEEKSALLHTIGYTVDGLWDIGEFLGENKFLSASKAALDGVLSAMDEKGYISGRLDNNWKGTVEWACLTGLAQIAITCMKVYNKFGDKKYFNFASLIKEYLKTCQNNQDDIMGGGKGAMWGSWPISGDYGQWQSLNWPAKYFADFLIKVIEKNKS